jgi:formylglycine-generating enzyme required for sulfatase activity
MHGNVYEWCQDRYGVYPKVEKAIIDPVGPPTGDDRVLRGGGFNSDAKGCRTAIRIHARADFRGSNLGFRVVCVKAR